MLDQKQKKWSGWVHLKYMRLSWFSACSNACFWSSGKKLQRVLFLRHPTLIVQRWKHPTKGYILPCYIYKIRGKAYTLCMPMLKDQSLQAVTILKYCFEYGLLGYRQSLQRGFKNMISLDILTTISSMKTILENSTNWIYHAYVIRL